MERVLVPPDRLAGSLPPCDALRVARSCAEDHPAYPTLWEPCMSVTEPTIPATSFPRRLADHKPNLATLTRLRASGRVPSLSLPARRALSRRADRMRPCAQRRA